MGLWADVMSALRSVLNVVAMLGCLALAGCQGSSLEEGLESVAAPPGSAVTSVSNSTYGNGPILISMILSKDPGLAARGSDNADGARLALDDLGAGQLRIDFTATLPQSNEAVVAVEKATAAGAKLIVGPSDPQDVASITTVVNISRPPVLTLTAEWGRAGSNMWPLYADTSGISSGLESIKVAIGAKKKNFVVLHEAGMAPSSLEELSKGIAANGGVTVGFIAYPPDRNLVRSALEDGAPLFRKANVAVVLGGGPVVAYVLENLANGTFGSSIETAIATSQMPKQFYQQRFANGLLIALPSLTRIQAIKDRFKAKYDREPTYDAAIGYDSIAIAAGLVRSLGPQGISSETLTSSKGFKGTTGLFRLSPQGKIERRMIVYRIENGELKVVQDEGDGF